MSMAKRENFIREPSRVGSGSSWASCRFSPGSSSECCTQARTARFGGIVFLEHRDVSAVDEDAPAGAIAAGIAELQHSVWQRAARSQLDLGPHVVVGHRSKAFSPTNFAADVGSGLEIPTIPPDHPRRWR